MLKAPTKLAFNVFGRILRIWGSSAHFHPRRGWFENWFGDHLFIASQLLKSKGVTTLRVKQLERRQLKRADLWPVEKVIFIISQQHLAKEIEGIIWSINNSKSSDKFESNQLGNLHQQEVYVTWLGCFWVHFAEVRFEESESREPSKATGESSRQESSRDCDNQRGKSWCQSIT
jgi:hypothetical protein